MHAAHFFRLVVRLHKCFAGNSLCLIPNVMHYAVYAEWHQVKPQVVERVGVVVGVRGVVASSEIFWRGV